MPQSRAAWMELTGLLQSKKDLALFSTMRSRENIWNNPQLEGAYFQGVGRSQEGRPQTD